MFNNCSKLTLQQFEKTVVIVIKDELKPASFNSLSSLAISNTEP